MIGSERCCRPSAARGVQKAGCHSAARSYAWMRLRESRRTLPIQRSISAFAFGASAGVADDLDVVGRPEAVEGVRELRVAVVDQEPHLSSALGGGRSAGCAPAAASR